MAKYSAADLDKGVDGFTSIGQVALYQACIGRAMSYVQELRNDVALADRAVALGPGNYQIPFMVREILMLCFSCLDSSIDLLKKNSLLVDANTETNLMEAGFVAEDFTAHNGDLLDPWKDVAQHYALDDNGNKFFKTHHLWNTLKHRGMLPMTIAPRDDQSPILTFNMIKGLDVVTFLNDFCGKVKAWVDKLSEKDMKL